MFWWQSFLKTLGKLLDEAQLEVCNGEEADGHDSQSQVVLPETPGGVIHPLLLQKFLPSPTPDTTQTKQSVPLQKLDIKLTERQEEIQTKACVNKCLFAKLTFNWKRWIFL